MFRRCSSVRQSPSHSNYKIFLKLCCSPLLSSRAILHLIFVIAEMVTLVLGEFVAIIFPRSTIFSATFRAEDEFFKSFVPTWRIIAFGFVTKLGCIQLFRQRLSHKSVKAYATMPIGIMGRKNLALID